MGEEECNIVRYVVFMPGLGSLGVEGFVVFNRHGTEFFFFLLGKSHIIIYPVVAALKISVSCWMLLGLQGKFKNS